MPPPNKKAKAAIINQKKAAEARRRIKLSINDENNDPNNASKPQFEDKAIQCDPIPEFQDKETQCNQLQVVEDKGIQCEPSNDIRTLGASLDGRRLVSLSSLVSTVQNATSHSNKCNKGPIRFHHSTKQGLATKVYFKCGCGKIFFVSTDNDHESLKANDALAWGCQISATGFLSAIKLLSSLDLPTPCFNTFKKRQDLLYDDLCKTSKFEMAKWANREAEIAVEKGDFVTVDGIKYPAITVVVDGGWAKRSYGHSFSSNCGVAVIIGANTRKVIYADTRISSCYICQRTRDKNEVVPKHRCYKNWSKSPTSMESDILLEGFKSSISMYNLVYYKFIGDGDSSVFSKVAKVYNGIEVQKVECMNHVVKNLTSRLLEIGRNQIKGSDAPDIPLTERQRIAPELHRIRTGIRRAIIYNNEQNNHWQELRKDILNVLRHVFGEHGNCKSYFCDKNNPKGNNNYGTATTMVCWNPLLKVINRVADFSESLIHALTSNPAESFMALAAKYLEGKRKNFGQRYLYNLRMIGAVFCYNESSFWATEAYVMIKGTEPKDCWKRQSILGKKRRGIPRKYRVSRPLKYPTYAVAGDWDYGSNPRQWDLSADVRDLKIEEKRIELQVTVDLQSDIESSTRSQADSPRWFSERKDRITASKAGRIFKLRDTTNNSDILNEIFGRKRIVKKVQTAMDYGKDNEHNAIIEYEQSNGLQSGTVKRCGLFVDLQNGELAASPDGLIGNVGILEVKCPESLSSAMQPAKAWPSVSKSNCSFFIKDNQFHLKNNHIHYYQVIMQLHVTQRQWCDYFVWSEYGNLTIRVHRDSATEIVWLEMREKLLRFWSRDLAPELVDSRYSRGILEYYNPPPRQQQRKTKKTNETSPISGSVDPSTPT